MACLSLNWKSCSSVFHHLGGIGLHLLCLLLLLIDILLIVYDLADRRIDLRGYFHQIQLKAFRKPLGFPQWIDTRLRDIVSHKPYLRCRDPVIDPWPVILGRLAVAVSIVVAALSAVVSALLHIGPGSSRIRALFYRCCDKVVLL